jgi:hypothetical protein
LLIGTKQNTFDFVCVGCVTSFRSLEIIVVDEDVVAADGMQFNWGGSCSRTFFHTPADAIQIFSAPAWTRW